MLLNSKEREGKIQTSKNVDAAYFEMYLYSCLQLLYLNVCKARPNAMHARLCSAQMLSHPSEDVSVTPALLVSHLFVVTGSHAFVFVFAFAFLQIWPFLHLSVHFEYILL